jgi:hypothetical protein
VARTVPVVDLQKRHVFDMKDGPGSLRQFQAAMRTPMSQNYVPRSCDWAPAPQLPATRTTYVPVFHRRPYKKRKPSRSKYHKAILVRTINEKMVDRKANRSNQVSEHHSPPDASYLLPLFRVDAIHRHSLRNARAILQTEPPIIRRTISHLRRDFGRFWWGFGICPPTHAS